LNAAKEATVIRKVKTYILIVGDDAHLALALHTVLLDSGYSVRQGQSEEEDIDWSDPELALAIHISCSAVEVRSPQWTESVRLSRPVDTNQLLALAERSTSSALVPQNSGNRKTLESRASQWETSRQSTSRDGQLASRTPQRGANHP